MKYSLDTSSIVEPYRRAYPPDVLPSLWSENLPGLINQGELRATREVLVELERQDDELLEWAKEHSNLFLEIDEAIQQAVTAILGQFPNLINAQTGRSGADPFVIALAQVNGCAVVTEEKTRPTRPKIPDVCAALNVPCLNMLALIRQEGWTYR